MTASKFDIPDCRFFNGYKPCHPYKVCEGCPDRVRLGTRILIINLDAMGDVLMTTAQLAGIKRKYSESHISWITRKNAASLLKHNPYLDQVYVWDDESRMVVRNQQFDVILNADKGKASCAFINEVKAAHKYGFGLDAQGRVVPLSSEADYNFRMGIDDYFKFYVNDRTGQDILAETFDLPYQRDEYVLNLDAAELAFCQEYRRQIGLDDGHPVIGFNTGCSDLYPLKRLTAEQQIRLAKRVHAEFPEAVILLLGGLEDTERNGKIQAAVGDIVIATPTDQGLRKGLCFINLCDIVVTGDTFGMHAAIGLRKHVVAWFGLSCAAEVDLYDRGMKLVRDIPCGPCWKRTCDNPICVTEFEIEEVVDRVGGLVGQMRPAEPMLKRA